MSAFLIRSCILLAFITAGHSLICEVCSSRNATMCNGKMMTCDANMDTCEHSIVRSNAYGQMFMVFKGCAKACKDLYFTESFTTGRNTIKRVCCNSDYCNDGEMETEWLSIHSPLLSFSLPTHLFLAFPFPITSCFTVSRCS
ncbi:phospholipase A2 inhibitor NAI-like isoform X2 [Pleurodeles waltl]|uniref:phospholipase A2 inhibitor NAI-like isoform X2 n=1 Tax=Pleurodeles waltl TaxID=8319 RepID=UPI0037098A47